MTGSVVSPPALAPSAPADASVAGSATDADVCACRRFLRARLDGVHAYFTRAERADEAAESADAAASPPAHSPASTDSSLVAAAAQLEMLFERTVRFGENQSGLLVGSVGGGTRATVSRALRRLRARHGAFTTVYLNGVLLQNELEAFKEMIAQLSRSQAVKHPTLSYWTMYEYLRSLLVAERRPVLVLLDAFEQFAVASNNAKQLLLYNLLDWLQSKDVRMGVLGITTDFNVVDNLEKRVRSRFSNLQIVMERPTFPHIQRLLVDHLTLPTADSSTDDSKNDEDAIVQTLRERSLSPAFVEAFNARVRELLLASIPKSALLVRLEFDFDIGKPVAFFLRLAATAVSFLSGDEPMLTPAHFSRAKHALEPDHQLAVLKTIGEHALALLVGMSHLEKEGRRVVTLEMVYKRWEQFHRTHDMLLQMPTRSEAQHALEHLLRLQLVDDAGDAFRIGRASKHAAAEALQPEYRAVYSNVPPRSLEGMIRNRSIVCSTVMSEWALNGGGATAI